MSNQDDKLTYAEAADRIGVSILTIKRAVTNGELVAIRYNAKVVRIRVSDLDKYESNCITSNSN